MLLVLEHYQQREGQAPRLVRQVNEEIRWKTNEHFVELVPPPAPVVVSTKPLSPKKNRSGSPSRRRQTNEGATEQPSRQQINGGTMEQPSRKRSAHPRLSSFQKDMEAETERRERFLEAHKRWLKQQKQEEERELELLRLEDQRRQARMARGREIKRSQVSAQSRYLPGEERRSKVATMDRGHDREKSRHDETFVRPANGGLPFTSRQQRSGGRVLVGTREPLNREIRSRNDNNMTQDWTSAGLPRSPMERGSIVQSPASHRSERQKLMSNSSRTSWSPASSPTLSPMMKGVRGFDDEMRPRPLSPSSLSPRSSPGHSQVDSPGLHPHREETMMTRMSPRRSRHLAMDSLELESVGTVTDNEDLDAIQKSRKTRLSIAMRRLEYLRDDRDRRAERGPEIERLVKEVADIQQAIALGGTRGLRPHLRESSIVDSLKGEMKMESMRIVPEDDDGYREGPQDVMTRPRGRAFDIHAPEDEPQGTIDIGSNENGLSHDVPPSSAANEGAESAHHDADVPQVETSVDTVQANEQYTTDLSLMLHATFDWSPFTKDYIHRLLVHAQGVLEDPSNFRADEEWCKVIPMEIFEELEQDVVNKAEGREQLFRNLTDILVQLRTIVPIPQPSHFTSEFNHFVDALCKRYARGDNTKHLFVENGGMFTFAEVHEYLYRLMKQVVKYFDETSDQYVVEDDFKSLEYRTIEFLRSQRLALFMAVNQVLVELFPGFATGFQPPNGEPLTLHALATYGRRPDLNNLEHLEDQIVQRLLRFQALQTSGTDVAAGYLREVGELIGRKVVSEEERDWQNLSREENELVRSMSEDVFARLMTEVDLEVERVTQRIGGDAVERPELEPENFEPGQAGES